MSADYLTPEQCAEERPLFKAEWYRVQLRTGRLQGSKVGGRWVTTLDAIDEMIAAGSNSTRRRRRRAVA